MGRSLTQNRSNGMQSFIQKLRQQDQDDERYILKNKLIPLFVGLVMMSVVLMITQVKGIVLLAGCFLIFATLLVSLLLVFHEYKEISRERFDASLLDFLKQKERRMTYWRSTHFKYYVMFALYMMGLALMIVGNTSITRQLTGIQLALFTGALIGILLFFWIMGEHFYRSRHKEKHEPLLDIITQIKSECEEDWFR